jgi:hypothetical protein
VSVLGPEGVTLFLDSSASAVSPDGRALAFTTLDPSGASKLWVRPLDALEARPLAGTEDAGLPFWSPDSGQIAFFADGKLKKVPVGGGTVEVLCDAKDARGGTWGTQGTIVFSPSNAGPLQSESANGGEPHAVTTLDAAAKEVLHLWPWFLPDGRHLLFLALPEGQTRGTIWATAVDNPARTRIVGSSGGAAAYAAGWLLSTTATPRSLVAQPFDPERLTLQGTPQPIRDQLPSANTGGFPGVAVSSSGVLVVDRPPPTMSQLVWMDRSGRELARVSPRASLSEFALAPDERRVVGSIRSADSGTRTLWLFDGLRPDGTRLTYEGGPTRPLWALDGRHIYFTENKGGWLLSTLAIGATAPTAFEPSGPFVHFEDVTRDGRYVVFKSSKVPAEVWIQRVDGTERRALVQGQFSATQPRVSPDGHWLAYTLSLPSGSEVFAQPFDRPGDRVQVSVKDGIGPVWRDDGRELYYESSEGLMAVPMTERDGALTAGTPQKLFATRTQGYVTNQPHNVEVAAHGQKFLVNTIVGDSDNAPLEVTFNWTTGLKK